MILGKIVILQCFWFLSVFLGYQYNGVLILIALSLAGLNFKFFTKSANWGKYLFCMLFFTSTGVVIDGIPSLLLWVKYPGDTFPFWLTSLYIVFICYYGDIFDKFRPLPRFINVIVGSIAGSFAYYSGGKLAGVEILSIYYLPFIALCWGIFFYLSLRIYYENFIWNSILDASIYYSFDKSGFSRHSKEFSSYSEKKQAILITGGSSGIGLSCAKTLQSQNCNVYITGRNLEKGSKVENDHNLKFLPLDMGSWDKITEFVLQLPETLDGVVLNAGGMPETFRTNKYGVESQIASQFFGHYFLIKELIKQGKLQKGSRVIFVSSGGMYLKNADLSIIFEDDNYNKVSTYANVKRIQVMGLDILSEEFKDYDIVGMHPGWVDTPGLRSAISDFSSKMENKLRSPEQGADTILWLLQTKDTLVKAGFYFDRKQVRKHFLPHTLFSNLKKKKLALIINQVSKNVF